PAPEEDVEQDVEPLGQVLHVLGHRAGDVHQAEHHRLRDRLRLRLEPPIAHIHRVDIWDQAAAPHLAPQFLLQLRSAGAVFPVRAERRDFLAQLFQIAWLRTLESDAPRQAVPYRAQQGEIGGRPGDRIAGAVPSDGFGVDDPPLREVWKLQILQEQIDELVAGEGEAEIVLTLAVRAAFRSAAPAALWPRDRIAGDVFLVAGQQVVADPAGRAAVQGRFMHTLRGQHDLTTLVR